MSALLTAVKALFASKSAKQGLLSVLYQLLVLLNSRRADNKEKNQLKKDKMFEDKADEVADSGSLSDLKNLKR